MNECRSGNACYCAGGQPTTSGSIALSLESPYNTCTDFAAESSYHIEFLRYVPPPTVSNHGAKNINASRYSSPKALNLSTLPSSALYDSAEVNIVLKDEISERYVHASRLSVVVIVRHGRVERRLRTSKKTFKHVRKCVPVHISALLIYAVNICHAM